jgi:DNA-binding protein HU-beta
MNKHDLIEAIAASADITKVAAESALNAVTGSIVDTLKQGGEVAIAGFGKFETSHRAERAGRNPKTGESIIIKACTVPKFKAAKALKDAVNQKD